ncbi:zinc finger CCCH domain-containing 44-like [Olea europaea subsp. europaea]|uniref:Zinc finger CCCH domain-containing 44-like n=1 Tax=Olea europaea subsp. europaea TaxID=158383 RepID=A0A8S0TD05_OLEEU|nr:zinc finger CCCH domain-containing 44-like [Olea europaea subsp. europaea]
MDRGCPKAYHPACIKRDESFFRSKAKWNCGWHICSVCQKASHYMCYTCTYSLCMGCTKDADYVCIRGNKGFCTICMKTIMLIENKDKMNSESVQVDFDDSSSWEYLFKAYWIYLKEKLSLTLSELTQAKNPCKEVGTVACTHLVTDVHHNTRDGKVSVSYRSSEHLESSNPKGQLTLQKEDSLSTESLGISKEAEPSHIKGNNKSSTDEGMDKPSVDEGTEWASKDLLEFVAHMRNGDTSVLSQFDVQSLLLDYIKRNNLQDACQKSQINCDLRLKNLFGKPCIGHTDALNRQFHGMSKFPFYASSKALELGAVPDNRLPEGYGDKYSIARTQYEMISGCDHEDQSNNQSQASQSSEEILRSLAAANGKGSRSDLTPLPRLDSPKVDGDIRLSDLPSPTPKASSQDCEVWNAENQQSASSDIPVQNSDILDLPCPTRKPSDEYQATDPKRSLLVMNGAHLPEIANKWSGYSPTPAKPSIEEWDNDLVAASSLKPLEAMSVHAAIWFSNSNQHTHSSQSHLTSDFRNWQGIVDEPIELDALSVESVSDLLAEVDAMESQSGLASPTSGTKFCKELMQDFGKEVTEDSKDYCFGSIGDFCQTPDPGETSSLSSTRDRQLTCQPTVACEPVGGLVTSEVHTPGRSSSGHSSWETESTDTLV